MPTEYFASLAQPFVTGLLHKCRALAEVELNPHQRSRLREAISIELRKLCDILVPAARPPRVSESAQSAALELGIDLRTVTWHAQKKVDGYRTFTYEHMTPIKWFVQRIGTASTVEEVLEILDEHLSVAWVTKEEDAALRRLGYTSNRPNPAVAYQEAGIELLPAQPDPDVRVAPADSRASLTPPIRLRDISPPLHAGDRWLPRAWAQGAEGIPAPLTARSDAAELMLAHWAPLLHLLTWGLGWVRPDIGLSEWRRAGGGENDPILGLLDSWWLPSQLDDFLAWASFSGALTDFAQDFVRERPDLKISEAEMVRPVPVEKHVLERLDSPRWREAWEAHDPYRIVEHLRIGWWPSPDSEPLNPVPVHVGNNTLLVATHQYNQWAKLPVHYQYDGSSSIDMYVAQVGSLGTFSRSARTGMWHRTTEDVHLLGFHTH